MYLRNIREVQWTQVIWAALASLAIAGAGWFMTGIFSSQRNKRSLALFSFVTLFHFYGLYYDQIAGWLPFLSRPLLAHLLALVPPAIIWLALTVLIFKSRRSFSVLNRVLQTAVLLLLAWNIGGITIHHAGQRLDHWQQSRAGIQRLPAGQTRTPDIYCFVLDEFAAPESVRRLFGYDNSAFTASLRRQGFFVAQQSRSPYTLTEPAIATILNLGEFSAVKDPFLQVRRNAVAALLKNRGYRIIDFACQRSLFLEAADQRFYYPLAHASIFFDDFYRALFERSLLRVLSDLWQLKKTDLSRFYRERILQVFKELPAVVKTPGPKLVFVHLFSPHEPFVFDAQGKPADPLHIWDHADPAHYLEQYIYICRRLLQTAAMIIADSPAAPVIIMQSDHGYRGSRRRGKESQPVSLSEMTLVFNALYLPGVPLAGIEPSLSPLNNFRLVFNSYFGTRYPLLNNP
ncbi:MAG: hypothetical protein ABII93_03600 [Chrysiogenia bacterium]